MDKDKLLDLLKSMDLKNANEELPKANGQYLCYVPGYDGWKVLSFSVKYGLFNVRDFFSEEDAKLIAIHPSHWAELPQLPSPEEILSLSAEVRNE